jgi:methylaspartate ammonia-lyase
MYCIGLFLDFKKAFDTVPHDILLEKLEKLGITGTALNLFASYLSNRTQKVEVNSTLSDSKELNISVFQGTVGKYILRRQGSRYSPYKN